MGLDCNHKERPPRLSVCPSAHQPPIPHVIMYDACIPHAIMSDACIPHAGTSDRQPVCTPTQPQAYTSARLRASAHPPVSASAGQRDACKRRKRCMHLRALCLALLCGGERALLEHNAPDAADDDRVELPATRRGGARDRLAHCGGTSARGGRGAHVARPPRRISTRRLHT